MITKLLNFLGISKPEPTAAPTKQDDIIAALAKAGHEKGVDPKLLLGIAKVESGLNPKAKASTSSALGLFQFIDSTWDNLVKLYGAKSGIKAGVEVRTDPYLSALMMCELINENKRYLEGKGLKDLSVTDLYLAHFLGPKKAMMFIAQKRTNGVIKGITLFAQEAKANSGVFYSGKDARSLDEIYDFFTTKLKVNGL